MRPMPILLAIAALAVSCVPAVADEQPGEDRYQVPGQITCQDGRVSAVTILLPAPGVVRVEIPADVCTRAQPNAAPAPQRPASSTSRRLAVTI